MKKLTAILISNAATNEIYLPNNTSIMVTKEILKDFLAAKDFSDWNGENSFEGDLDDIFLENQDNIVAWYAEDELVISRFKLADLQELLEEKCSSSLQDQYNNWREMQKELDAETDCGEQSAREDFEAYIDEMIAFDEMLKLERYHDRYVAE